MRPLTLIGRSGEQSSRNATSDAGDVRTESDFSDDSEIETIVEKEGFSIRLKNV